MTFEYSKTNHGTLQPRIWIGDYTGTNYSTSYVYIWGAQIEYGSTLSAYQPKAASTNLINYSEEFDNAGYWIKNSLASVTPNATIAPDGTLTADKLVSPVAAGLTRKSIYQPTAFNLTAGVVYTFSVYVKAAEFTTATIWFDSVNAVPPDGRTSPGYWGSDCRIDLTNGSNVASVTTPGAVYGIAAGNGWYRLVLTAKMTVTSGINFGIALGSVNGAANEVGNGVDGIYVWGAQVEVGSLATPYKKTTLGTNITLPRFVKSDSPSTYAVVGEYDEVTFNPTTPIFVNIFPNSDDWTLNVQLTQNTTLTSANTVAPDSTLTGSRLTSTITGGTNTALIQKITPSISKSVLPWCASVYIKQGTSPTTTLNLAFVGGTTYKEVQLSLTWATLALAAGGSGYSLTGSLGYGIIDAGNGWYRIWACLLNTYAATQLAGRMYVRDYGTSNVSGEYSYIWGLQIEQGYVPTVYQSTGVSGVISTPAFANKIINTGDNFVKNEYDEWTGIPIVDISLKLWLDAGQSSSYPGSGTVWSDLSSSGYSLNSYANAGAPPVFNVSPGTFSVNTVNQFGFASATSSLPNIDSSTFTIEAWVLHTSFNAGGEYNNLIAIRENFPLAGFRFGVLTLNSLATDTTGAPRFWTGQSGGTITTPYTTYPITLNTWYHVTVTYDGTNCLIYVNGSLYSSTTGTYVVPTGRTLYITANTSGCKTLNGQISAFKWYTRVLAVDEIAQNFNALRKRYGV